MPDLKHPLTARFTNALALAANIHRLQARRGTQVPYMAHILGVASIALEHAANEDEAIAAVLHDAIEDAPKRLGASGVRGAIERAVRRGRAEDCRGLHRLRRSTEAALETAGKRSTSARIAHEDASTLLVSASDKLHKRLRAILSDFRAEGIGVFDRFNKEAGVDGAIGYYRGLGYRLPGAEQAARGPSTSTASSTKFFDRTVTALSSRRVGVVGKWPPGSASAESEGRRCASKPRRC